MTIHLTTNFAIAHIDVDTPLVELAEASRQAAVTIDAALTRGGIAPPVAQDLVAVAARVTATEQALIYTPPTEVAYQTPFAGLTDTQWSGVRYWRRAGVVTVNGALRNNAASAANALIATLPARFRPPIYVEAVTASITLKLFPNGELRSANALPIGVLALPMLTFAAAQP